MNPRDVYRNQGEKVGKSELGYACVLFIFPRLEAVGVLGLTPYSVASPA